MRIIPLCLAAWVSLAAALSAAETQGPAVGAEVLNFAALDTSGRFHEMRRAEGKAMVLFFTSNGCPIARQSYGKLNSLRRKFGAQGVNFWVLNSGFSDDRASIAKEAREFGVSPLPMLMDEAQGVARMLEVKRTCEAVAIDTKTWKVFYRGAVDDQFVEGAKKPAATEKYLSRALEQFLAGQPVTEAQTAARGCLIHFESEEGKQEGQISYAKQIAPILQKKCADCHSPGNIGPWSMTSYQRVKGMAEMMEETILSRRMPPWDADPHYGKFSNDRSLTVDEKRLLLAWIEQGAPRGEGEDPLASYKAPVADWPLGQPDHIVKLPKAEEIPATGVLDYRHIKVAAPYTNDVWLKAIAVKPGNRKVAHHVILRAKFENSGDEGSGRGIMIAGWAPGADPQEAPADTGIFLGKNAIFDIELHYTTMGSPQTDETEIGLYLLPAPPARPMWTGAAYNTEFSIPPGERDSQTFALHGLEEDTMIYSLAPHMHMRGSWLKYEALYPNGKRETLLSVPRYDFNWQTSYRLVEPKRLPKGTWLLCTGGFDNSDRNPANPGSDKRVGWGEQSWDEMFIGFYTASPAPPKKAETTTTAQK